MWIGWTDNAGQRCYVPKDEIIGIIEGPQELNSDIPFVGIKMKGMASWINAAIEDVIKVLSDNTLYIPSGPPTPHNDAIKEDIENEFKDKVGF